MGSITRFCRYLILLGILSFTQAYLIDDQNTAIIQYNPENFWFHHSPDTRVDHSQLYNSTYTYGLCQTIHHCSIKIPFTGSGVAVVQLLWAPINASITVDGGSAQNFLHDGSCQNRTPPGCYNTLMYSLQSLAYGNHLLEIAFQDYNGGVSDFNLDYIDVNEAHVAPDPSIPTSVSPSTRTSISPSNGTPVSSPPQTSISPSNGTPVFSPSGTSVSPSIRTSISPVPSATETSVSPSNEPLTSPPPGTSVSPSDNNSFISGKTGSAIAGGVVGGLALVLLFAFALIYLFRRQNQHATSIDPESRMQPSAQLITVPDSGH